MERRRCPVFVMGCPRSGTNLLYDALLSSGGFAIYRGRLLVYQVLIPRFGRIDRLENRTKMMAIWLRSKGFRRSGLDGAELTAKVLKNCRSGGDFVSIVMGEIARKQGAGRWAVYDPETVVRVETIKREIPDALFIHIIRDGRDVAMSLRKLGEFNPFPWTRSPRSLEETALYWEWMVQKGRSYGRHIESDYAEVRYEDFVANPQNTLKDLSKFLDQDLDPDRIRSVALGTMSSTNSSFPEETAYGADNPVQRWKRRLSQEQVASLEWHIGQTLEAVGYSLTTCGSRLKPGVANKFLRSVYPLFLDTKFWLKTNTPMRRLSSLTRLELTHDTTP
jgi:hypothetical protein